MFMGGAYLPGMLTPRLGRYIFDYHVSLIAWILHCLSLNARQLNIRAQCINTILIPTVKLELFVNRKCLCMCLTNYGMLCLYLFISILGPNPPPPSHALASRSKMVIFILGTLTFDYILHFNVLLSILVELQGVKSLQKLIKPTDLQKGLTKSCLLYLFASLHLNLQNVVLRADASTLSNWTGFLRRCNEFKVAAGVNSNSKLFVAHIRKN